MLWRLFLKRALISWQKEMLKQRIATLSKLTVIGFAALVLAVLALLGAAFLTDNALLLISTALIVLCVANFIAQYLLWNQRFTCTRIVAQSMSMLVLLGLFYMAVLRPTTGESRTDLADVQYWNLVTGSRIAYIKLTPAKPTHTEPIIFLHGGPGVSDLQGDAAYFGRLREEGYAVYVYDQLGSGRSSRLQDPSGYTVERDAADLEEIRKQIGAEKVILIGHSYGAGLAAMYIAQHGEHVAKLIAVSPGALVGGVEGGSDLQSRLSTAEKLVLYSLVLQPRPLTVYVLLQINPRAAHNFASDLEMDTRFEDVYAATEPALHCANTEPAQRLDGLGFYANQFPQSAQRVQPKDITHVLRRYKIPTLVIKGSCDYLTWASAIVYLDAFQQGPAQLVYLSGAGHNAYRDKPHEFELSVKAFLNSQPLPNQYIDKHVPADYEKGY
jgi:proline iminopeptidase